MYKSAVSFIKEGDNEPLLSIPGENVHIPREKEFIILHNQSYEVYYVTHVFTKNDYMVAYVYLKELKR